MVVVNSQHVMVKNGMREEKASFGNADVVVLLTYYKVQVVLSEGGLGFPPNSLRILAHAVVLGIHILKREVLFL
jgi:hypothetical protein